MSVAAVPGSGYARGLCPRLHDVGANLTREVLRTFVMTLVAAAIFSERVLATGPAAGAGRFLVGCLVRGIGLHVAARQATRSVGCSPAWGSPWPRYAREVQLPLVTERSGLSMWSGWPTFQRDWESIQPAKAVQAGV